MRGRMLAAGLALTVLGAAGCGASARHRQPSTSTATPVARAKVRAQPKPPSRQPKPKAKPKPQPNPGTLPQTHQLPSAHTPQFQAEMAALWSGVARDSLDAARPAFFPLAAYVQVKAIGDPQADYADRLLADYRLDLGAAHGLLGSRAQTARLLNVEVPETYAHWVDPGACYNRVGYYEVPNARVVYSQGGQVRSFGIASMISWRGVWYVVHLGAVVRPGPGGVVDDPSVGAGVATPSSTC